MRGPINDYSLLIHKIIIMKLFNHTAIRKSIFAGIFAAIATFVLTSCTKKIDFLKSSVVPAARGYVQVTKDNNSNYVIHLNVENLAEASRLTPPRKTYIVWSVSNKDAAKNIGQIDSSTRSFSKDLKASFESTSASKPNKIFITAEDESNVQYASSEIILTTGNF